jgi:aminoglycoside phosphotransferase (APT) family kinase protein
MGGTVKPSEHPPQGEQNIRLLLDHLTDGGHQREEQWRDWTITPIAGGRNNLLYRATGPLGDLVVKFTVRDGRNRAGREYWALADLRQAGLSIAPQPLLLDRDTYAQPVVVQTWLEGNVDAAPPATDAEWQALLRHLALVHTVTPGKTSMQLPWATINASDADEARQRVRQQLAHLPRKAQPPSLQSLVRRLDAARFPRWPPAPVTLCRCDNNVANFVRRPGLWASVDWEYSGWGDPAFDVANLVTHVAYLPAPPSRWEWVRDAYSDSVDDGTASLRIRTYCKILLVWWLARLARYLYEIPRGQDRRLVDWPPGWQADIEAKVEQYVDLAQAAYA